MKQWLLIVACVAGCGSHPAAQVVSGPDDMGVPADPLDPLEAAARCSSGVTRDPNESPGQEMMPGHACNACHHEENAASGEGDAPIFTFAGTVYPSGHEPDDCVGSGAQGAEVVVTDATGKSFTAAVNTSGNFSFEADPFVLPLRAKVVFQGRTREMLDPQDSGDCNSCHTQSGDEGAPGRITLP